MGFDKKQLTEVTTVMDAFLERRRPPMEIRNQVDLGYRIEDQSITVVEIRPFYLNPDQIMEVPIAKTTYVKSKKVWKVFWMRGNLKWYAYPPMPYVKTLEEFATLVEFDEHYAFFG